MTRSNQQSTLYRFVWVALILIGVISCSVMGILGWYNNSKPTIPQPGSAISFRADAIVLLRMVTKPPYESIEIHKDGAAYRFYHPVETSGYSKIMLTPNELDGIERLRADWCQHVPQFRIPQTNELFYDLGFECGGYTTKQAKVPIDMLPSIFIGILKRLPPSSSP